MNLHDILAHLKPEEKRRLDHMFELEQPDFITFSTNCDKYFVGVHLYQIDYLIPIERDGVWSYGKMPT